MPEATGWWRVEIGKGKSSYRIKYSLRKATQAWRYYDSIVVFGGAKNRLVDPHGEIRAREITQETF